MTFKKSYYTTVSQAKDLVAGFRESFAMCEERVLGNGLFVNYGRCIAHLALTSGVFPHEISAEEINTYLYLKPFTKTCVRVISSIPFSG